MGSIFQILSHDRLAGHYSREYNAGLATKNTGRLQYLIRDSDDKIHIVQGDYQKNVVYFQECRGINPALQ